MATVRGGLNGRRRANRPAQKTKVFFLHPERSWRFRSKPLAVSLTWMLDSENLAVNIISSARANTKLPTLCTENKTVSIQ